MLTPAAEMSCSSQRRVLETDGVVVRQRAARVDERLLDRALDRVVLVEHVEPVGAD